MERTEVSSSNLKSVGYQDRSKELEVEFSNGGVYRYSEVPYETYSAFMNAPSKGSYFAHNIKGHFRALKVN